GDRPRSGPAKLTLGREGRCAPELTALACGLNVTLGTGTFTTAGWREAEKDRTAARSTSHTSQREVRAPVLCRCIITTRSRRGIPDRRMRNAFAEGAGARLRWRVDAALQ